MAKKRLKGARGRVKSRLKETRQMIKVGRALGIGGGTYAARTMIDGMIPTSLDPKIAAGLKIIGGELIANYGKDESDEYGDVIEGVGIGIQATGWHDLFKAFGVSGFNEDVLGLEDDSELAVALEGVDEVVDFDDFSGDEDILGEDDDDGFDGLDDVVNGLDDVVNGDDDMF